MSSPLRPKGNPGIAAGTTGETVTKKGPSHHGSKDVFRMSGGFVDQICHGVSGLSCSVEQGPVIQIIPNSGGWPKVILPELGMISACTRHGTRRKQKTNNKRIPHSQFVKNPRLICWRPAKL